jgi:hypothetical protein
MCLMLLLTAPAAVGAQQEKIVCGIENCHGIDISCGPDVPEICSQLYQIGDFCRAYARCELVDGLCQLKSEPVFESCVACVQGCLEASANDPMGAFLCEARCLEDAQPESEDDEPRGNYRGQRSKSWGR